MSGFHQLGVGRQPRGTRLANGRMLIGITWQSDTSLSPLHRTQTPRARLSRLPTYGVRRPRSHSSLDELPRPPRPPRKASMLKVSPSYLDGARPWKECNKPTVPARRRPSERSGGTDIGAGRRRRSSGARAARQTADLNDRRWEVSAYWPWTSGCRTSTSANSLVGPRPQAAAHSGGPKADVVARAGSRQESRLSLIRSITSMKRYLGDFVRLPYR